MNTLSTKEHAAAYLCMHFKEHEFWLGDSTKSPHEV